MHRRCDTVFFTLVAFCSPILQTESVGISKRLGHATVAITLDTYSHVLPGMQEEAAQKIDASLRLAIYDNSND